jgi:hypothetical protein
MMKWLTPVLSLALTMALAVCLGSGVFKPRNPPVVASRGIEAHRTVPKEVEAILGRSCGDCHSNQTRWPWYSALPVVSGSLRKEVDKGRKQMNFSDWNTKLAEGADEEQGTLNGICENVRTGTMPPARYRRVHHGSRLTPAETETVCSWVALAALTPAQ